jgi:hypothetical protein
VDFFWFCPIAPACTMYYVQQYTWKVTTSRIIRIALFVHRPSVVARRESRRAMSADAGAAATVLDAWTTTRHEFKDGNDE